MKKIICILFIGIMLLGATGCEKKYELSTTEALAWTRLRLAIAESVANGGSTTLTRDNVLTLKSLAKKYNEDSEWFSKSYLGYAGYGKTMDTDKNEISTLCDENYCATFTVENKDGNYYLVNYSFERSVEKTHEIWIVDRKEK